jgi:capsular exopolysaccharide synthesis family protein
MSRITEALARAKWGQAQAPQTDEQIPWDLDPEIQVELEAWRPEAHSRPSVSVSETQLRTPPLEPQTLSLPESGEYAEKLLGSPNLHSDVAEQYRRLGAALHQAQSECGVRVLMITSALPGEGKTLVASNLALVLSGSFGRRVLLIDGDLRRPCLHSVFGVKNLVGEFDRRLGDGHGLSPIKLSNTLSLVPGGEPQADPMRILSSGPMQALLKEAAARYDWVILDTPPIGLLPDARLLADAVDRVLLVIRAGSTPFDALQKSVDLVGKERILGTVLNRATASEVIPYGPNYGEYSGRVKGA